MISNEERTGMRDMRLSAKLRSYGIAYITDIDGLMLCFDFKTPVGLLECKHMNITDIVQMSKRPQVQAQKTLANNSQIGLYYVIYNPDRWIFNIAPMNDFAAEGLESETPVIYSDQQFYQFHCRIRNKVESKLFSQDRDWCHPEMKPFIKVEEEEFV